MKISVEPKLSQNHWPTLRRFMDEALDAPRGIRLHHINNIPLTAGRAGDIRNIMGKIRKADQRKNQTGIDSTDPAYGQSPYNALTFIVVPNLRDADISIHWHWPQTDLPWQDWLNISADHMPKEARSISSACDIEVILPSKRFTIQSAPTFTKGWHSIRPQLPAWLDILNTYQIIADDDFEILGTEPAQIHQPINIVGIPNEN